MACIEGSGGVHDDAMNHGGESTLTTRIESQVGRARVRQPPLRAQSGLLGRPGPVQHGRREELGEDPGQSLCGRLAKALCGRLWPDAAQHQLGVLRAGDGGPCIGVLPAEVVACIHALLFHESPKPFCAQHVRFVSLAVDDRCAARSFW